MSDIGREVCVRQTSHNQTAGSHRSTPELTPGAVELLCDVQNREASIHVSERDQLSANSFATSAEGLPCASNAAFNP